MTLHNLTISNNNKVIFWVQNNSLWFCTGGEKTLKHTQQGCYVSVNGGLSSRYDQDEENEFHFEFGDIGTEIESFGVELEITEELYLETLLASYEYFGEWNGGVGTDFDQSDIDIITEHLKGLGLVPDQEVPDQEVPDQEVPDLLAPEFELNTKVLKDTMDSEDWITELYINEQKAA